MAENQMFPGQFSFLKKFANLISCHLRVSEEKGTRGGMRTYLGTIPDYSQGDVVGVKLSGVTKGAPADKAGIKGGDIIVSLSGKELKNIYDYTYVLGALKVGTETEIKVKRKGKVISLKIVPGSRD